MIRSSSNGVLQDVARALSSRGSLDGVVMHRRNVSQEDLLRVLHQLGQVAHEPAAWMDGSVMSLSL